MYNFLHLKTAETFLNIFTLPIIWVGGQVPAADGKSFWTGGFKHELNAMWSWCTRDSPEPIDDGMTTDMTGDSTTPKPQEGQKRVQNANADNNCMQSNFDSTGALSANLCDAKSIYFACESVEKMTADLLVLFSMQQRVCIGLIFVFQSLTKNAELNVLTRKAVKRT